MQRLAVIGVGRMGLVRTKAFLETGRVHLCGVAARRLERAQSFAKAFACPHYFDDFHQLAACKPDFVLVETPHRTQEDVVRWALNAGYPVLIGGCPARTMAEANWVAQTAARKKLLVEAGYEARYKKAWQRTKTYLQQGALGRLAFVRAVALFPADPKSWYCDQEESGGMPVTHMSYAFINPLRWLLGDPLRVSAFANRKKNLHPGAVKQETCVANFQFPNQVLCSLTAGYLSPRSQFDDDSWYLIFTGTEGELRLAPGDDGPGALWLTRKAQTTHETFPQDAPFRVQAETFLDDLQGSSCCLNTPKAFLGDMAVVDAISQSVSSGETVAIAAAVQDSDGGS